MSRAEPIARLDWRTLITLEASTPADVAEALDAYFTPFAQPALKDGRVDATFPCLRCGKAQTGLAGFFLGGGFRWGLAHGEGHCGECGWPARAYHHIRDVATIRGVILQYHPDEVSADDRPAR